MKSLLKVIDDKTGLKTMVLNRGLIVSCQVKETDPLFLFDKKFVSVMAYAAGQGGATGIRANGPAHVRAIRKLTKLPIIGINKVYNPGYEVYITPTLNSVKQVVQAGADIVAVDATLRPRPGGIGLKELIQQIQMKLEVPVIADVSTLNEGLIAAEFGADLIATTLSGYTPYSPEIVGPDYKLLTELVTKLDIPIICEGRISTPEQAKKAIELGAYAVVVGTAITRPQEIAKRFAAALF